MNKTDLDILERAFAKEIDGGLYQTKSKVAQRLCDEGYLQAVEIDVSGVTCKGFVLTLLGNLAYCESERCRNNEVQGF